MTDLDIPQTDVNQGLKLLPDVMDFAKEGKGLVNGHVEGVGDVFSLVFDLKGFPVVSFAAADITGNINIR